MHIHVLTGMSGLRYVFFENKAVLKDEKELKCEKYYVNNILDIPIGY